MSINHWISGYKATNCQYYALQKGSGAVHQSSILQIAKCLATITAIFPDLVNLLS